MAGLKRLVQTAASQSFELCSKAEAVLSVISARNKTVFCLKLVPVENTCTSFYGLLIYIKGNLRFRAQISPPPARDGVKIYTSLVLTGSLLRIYHPCVELQRRREGKKSL